MNAFELKEKLASYGLEWLHRYYGTYEGTVHSVNDPDSLARLQLLVPEVYGDKPYKYWADCKGIYSGEGIGSYFLPNKGDKVWVSFKNGDPRFPIWEYGRFTKKLDGSSPEIKILRTTSGHTIEMNDKDGEERILIIDKEGNEIILDKNGILIKGDKIALGGNIPANKKALLGDNTKDTLSDICDRLDDICTACLAITVTCSAPGSPSSVPVNAAQFATAKLQIATIKAALDSLLSTKVTLD